jgi:hypothetical protein
VTDGDYGTQSITDLHPSEIGTLGGDGVAYQAVPPSRREIVASAAISVAVTVLAGSFVSVLIGFPALWIDIAMTDPTADASTPTGLPKWASQTLFLLAMAILWPIACRRGEGTWGDTIMDLKAMTPTGEWASRRRNAARTGALLAVFAVATLLGRPGVGVVVLFIQWLPSLVRADRRSLVELAVGVVPHTTATRKRSPVGRPSSTA